MANKILPEIVKKWSEFVRGVMGQIISEKSNNYAKSVRVGSSVIPFKKGLKRDLGTINHLFFMNLLTLTAAKILSKDFCTIS